VILPDVNVLLYAFREEQPDHVRYRDWLRANLGGSEPVGLSLHVLAGFVRVVTHPGIFEPPTPLAEALDFVRAVREAPASVSVEPSDRCARIFEDVCRQSRVKGAQVSDAYLAAMAIDGGCELVTADRGFARFPGLRWRHPFDG
jgi:uncharacterized protein